jgi:branched-chain amino acid transport system permease protein
MSFIITIVNFACITLIGICGTFVITGMTGYLSLGQAGFMALGAYTSAILCKSGVSFVISLPAGVLVGVVGGFLISLPIMKLRRDYIALITFGFGEAIIALINSLPKLTGGAMGISGIKKISTPLIIISTIIIILLVRNFKYSKYGRECLALKTDELAAKSIGIDVNRTKLMVFVYSAAIASYSGVLYGHYLQYIDSTLFKWSVAAEWVIFVFIGGANSLTGAVIATVVLAALPEVLRFADEWRIAIYCGVVLLVINFRSQGMFSEFELFVPKYLKKSEKQGKEKQNGFTIKSK